jgi:release factor glutamine methyltransferase
VSAILARATAKLSDVSVTARLDAEVLLAHVTCTTRAEIYARTDRALKKAEEQALDALIARRALGEPVAYLTGRREFWSLDLDVSRATLIPRPETELLVERALARIPKDAAASVVDLGTGCGAIALAIARERRGLRMTATDCSEAALIVARANARRLGVGHIEFLSGDWFVPLGERRFEIIVSNPPYVRIDDPHLQEGDVRFEPRDALLAGTDGLDAIRRIIADARSRLTRGGWLLLEHGFDQAGAVRTLLDAHDYREVHSYRDFNGHERVSEAVAPID